MVVDFLELTSHVEKRLTKTRYKHVLGVVIEAERIGNLIGLRTEKLKIAALLHDVAKCEEESRLKYIVEHCLQDKDLLFYDTEIWHGPAGSWIAQHELRVFEPEILEAIKYHTTGRAGMSLLAKIIFLADYTEAGRTGVHAKECREIINKRGINDALKYVCGTTINFLLWKNRKIHPDTIGFYNYLL